MRCRHGPALQLVHFRTRKSARRPRKRTEGVVSPALAKEDPPSSAALTITREWTLPERDEAGVRRLGFIAGSNALVLTFEDDTTLALPGSEIERFEYSADEERKRLVLSRRDGGRAVLNRFGMSRTDAERFVDELNTELQGQRGDAKLAPLLDVRDALEGSALKIHGQDASGYRESADPRRVRIEWSGKDTAIPRPGGAIPPPGAAFAPAMMLIAITLASAVAAAVAGRGWLAAVLVLFALAFFFLLRRSPRVGEVELTEHSLRWRSTQWPFRGVRRESLQRIARIDLVPFALLPPIIDKGFGALNLLDESGATLAQIPLALDAADRLRLFTALSRHLASSRRHDD